MNEQARRHPNVVNISEAEGTQLEKGTRFGFSAKFLAASTGAKSIGASWYELPPGRAAYPAHYHCVNEEALFVLEGEGAVRIGD